MIITHSDCLVHDRDYPISSQNVDEKMGGKDIVSLTDVQGSRVYVVYENEVYIAYIYSISYIGNRFRHLGAFRLDEINNFPLILGGRWGDFQIFAYGTCILYEQMDFSRRLQSIININMVIGGLMMISSGTSITHRILMRRNKKN